MDNRYYDKVIGDIFEPKHKFTTWRWLWYTLANIQRKMGVPISNKAIDELHHALNITDTELLLAESYEKDVHHDVVAHIKVLGETCPTAKPYIHLGATSCYITDNADIILMREALVYISDLLSDVIYTMASIGNRHTSTPTVGYTHYQRAQLTTIGKRFCMWVDSFVMDEDDISEFIINMKMLGCKGAVGTHSGLLPVLGSYNRCIELNYQLSNEFKFSGTVKISGQTYNRKLDSKMVSILSGIAQSAYKFAQDIRLLAHDGEIIEARTKHQVGSSAMPYKTNPIICEKICGLSRYVINGVQNITHTTATQMLERSLDDSAIRRITIPDMFMTVAEILKSVIIVLNNIVIDTDTSYKHVMEHLPNVVAEHTMANGVMNGGDRQDIHKMLKDGLISNENIDDINPMDYVGCAVEQATEYFDELLNNK